MLLDESRFPLVFLRGHEGEETSEDEILDRNGQFEKLLDRQQPFVLIAEYASHDHDNETPEQRKAKALFFKRTKDRMKQYCSGMIVIEGDTRMNTAARLAAAAASKALGFSIHFEPDEESAASKGRTMLDAQTRQGQADPR